MNFSILQCRRLPVNTSSAVGITDVSSSRYNKARSVLSIDLSASMDLVLVITLGKQLENDAGQCSVPIETHVSLFRTLLW